MSVHQNSFVNTCSLQMFSLCAIGILFASCIAGDNEASLVEPLIENLFRGVNTSVDNHVAEHPENVSSRNTQPALPEKNGSVPVSNAFLSVNNNSSNDSIHLNTSLSSRVKTEPRSSTEKTPSLPFDPEELLKDASPAIGHHQPPVGRKGVILEPADSEAKTDDSSNASTDKTCNCTIVASEGSQIEDCHSCNESKSPTSSVTTNISTPSQNSSSSAVATVILNTTATVNETNSLYHANGTVSVDVKAVTEPTSVSSDTPHAKNPAEDGHETRKPSVLLIDKAERLETSPYSQSAFIIPLVAILLTVPIVIAFVIILYKRGKEFWERRHYRRMDFLIDGMYND